MDTSLQQSDLEKQQIADQPRLAWEWTSGKSKEPYQPQVLDKCWSREATKAMLISGLKGTATSPALWRRN
ncbi:hypothetical protein M409DRAFT_30940 [Zasmidium cellare ATCC 36951]|uniref:Uncharacterized protein n=1 Tax=Zasmidium cellare ATCC 36951 TaxID=1080233 RepID=A0A6A6BX99_ZASCE|nr:uncharacterized protein M409DRAFT_30940 [Zasmidium cellare ATCC 36951]KAF2158570.1 hypothetical protein M409DRAFT_30940 [Zasmidium cellare ATCC 36951]